MDLTLSVEELNRRLQESEARYAQLEKFIQGQMRPDSALSSIAGDISLAQNGYQFSNYAEPPRSSVLSRSKSTISYPTQMASSTMGRDVPFQAHKRQRRAFSQQSGPTPTMMSRSVSNRSESQMPFIPVGHIAPLASPAVNPALDRFCSSRDEPANQSLQSGLSQRLPRVEENTPLYGVGLDPQEWIANFGEQGLESTLSSRFNISPNEFNFQVSSACPSMISGSSTAETTSPLTRQNSSFDNGSAVDMTSLASSQSQGYESFYTQDSLFSPSTANGVYPNTKRQVHDQALLGLGGASHQYELSAPNGPLLSSPSTSTNMERSISNTSCTSVRSNASTLERRAKDARERILQQASTTTIAPRPEEPLVSSSVSPMGTKRDSKVAVHKSNYQRPKHPKVFCDQCQDHPEGFRGEHELRRHVNAKHEGVVKKFICRDPADAGLVSNVEAINPLSKCKACVGGKQYGAYYNAAAHLRRTHFKPKTPRGKNKNNVNDERRGGKGGGDWPAMADLKLWFEEKMVKVDPQDELNSDQDDCDADMAEADVPEPTVTTHIEIYSHMGGNVSPFEINADYDLTVDAAADLSAITAPISSASGAFGYSPYSDGSPLGLDAGYAFSEQGASVFDTNLSSSNTITPSTFQEISHIPDTMW
ncbi:hypothetical protein B0J13DRAFT_622391 [Dactylonectria estremocensis]|uniref:DUF7896 domain-containing protein n=1 Tax=Dactylonectria estremocensis TaxID=1079267 RepID=A0A9P9J713_9HYPO|nr:hypothetical protein B0J13DRAFT_622391 [Dactylonectria estremocensis]